MLRPRIIPALTLAHEELVKTKRFKKPKYVGDPINAVRIFNEKEVDELMILDITASTEKRCPNYSLIEKLAGECFMPLTFGGGIKSLEQAKIIFELGVEKICLQNSIIENTSLISQISNRYGNQSVIASLDIKKSMFGSTHPYDHVKRKLIKKNWLNLIQKFIEAGVGEILLNSVDRDGMRCGPDLNLIREASKCIDVPLIALGGASNLEDMFSMLSAGASAASAGSLFVFHGNHDAVLISYPNIDKAWKL